jgi:DNA polymerase II small subunit
MVEGGALDKSSSLVSWIINMGYMIESDALDALSSLGGDVEKTVLRIVELKKASNEDKVIRLQDVVKFLPPKETLNKTNEVEPNLQIISDPSGNIEPLKPMDGYTKLFTDRFVKLLTLLKERPDCKGLISLDSVKGVSDGSKVRTAGLLLSKTERKNGVEIMLDDFSGVVKFYCRDNMAQQAQKIPLDSLVMVEGTKLERDYVLAERLTLPDIPDHRPTVFSHQVYAVLLSDLHIGSRMFLDDDFERFLRWLNRLDGDDEIVSKLKYIIIAGDLVDGVGVYPEQEFQLVEKDPRNQYEKAFKLLMKVPKYIKIVISPGNHDMVRQALPQPAISSEMAQGLYSMENVSFVGSPAYLKIHGVLFLVYHGRSLDDIIASTPELTYKRPSEAMKLLLRVRHLSPIYGRRTPISPEPKDMLVIDTVPDVMHSGHVHTLDYQNYKGALIINSGTFQGQTPFQSNMGLEPTPSIIPIVDLSSLSVIRRSFRPELP